MTVERYTSQMQLPGDTRYLADVREESMKKGRIIFMNGVSSAGKTTLALALQESSNEPYYLISQDTFCDMWPGKFWGRNPEKMFNHTMSLMYKTIRMFSDLGNNVIVDHVLLNNEILKSQNNEATLKECVEQLYDYPVLFVHVVCPIEELRRREKERGDRDIGNAESQLAYIDPQDTYDITVNTFENTTADCADQILKLLEEPGSMQAFRILKSQF